MEDDRDDLERHAFVGSGMASPVWFGPDLLDVKLICLSAKQA